MLFPFRPKAAAAVFVHPLDPPPRTAILAPRFRSTRTTRVFPHGWNKRTANFAPAALAGNVHRLLAAAMAGARPTHAVICLTSGVDHLLTEEQRDLLWEVFGVPIFEQILSPHNVLLASECAAHTGLHVTSATHDRVSGLARCPCGQSTAPAIAIPPRPSSRRGTGVLM